VIQQETLGKFNFRGIVKGHENRNWGTGSFHVDVLDLIRAKQYSEKFFDTTDGTIELNVEPTLDFLSQEFFGGAQLFEFILRVIQKRLTSSSATFVVDPSPRATGQPPPT